MGAKGRLGLIAGSQWDALGALITRFQQVNQRLRGNTRPVVVACRGLALGGGCELSLHAARVVAAAESYIGLVEVGAGVIPAGGGCKELVRRLDESLPAEFEGDPLPFGIEPNRKALAMCQQYALQQGSIPRAMPLEELFTPNTRSLT